MNLSSNYVSDIIDEIALEGLDGISCDALWKRLSVRPNFCFKIDENSKEFIWKICVRLNDLEFYELPEERPSLKYYDYLSLQKEHQEANRELDELYPYFSVKNENGVLGSCKYYSTRKNIRDEVFKMSLKAAEETYADRLVIVASQEQRNLALLGNKCPQNFDFSKSCVQYDILERIGRSRSLGVQTHGKGSLQSIVDDSKSIFHYLKLLVKHKIVKKQSLLGSLQTNPNGSKVYLMRFYGEYLNEYQLILQTAVEELKCRPNYRMPYDEFYQLFDPDKRSRVKKYSKTAIFRKYIVVSKLLPYREFFPNASQAEWEKRYQNGEKMIRCMQLRDPNTEINDVLEKDCDSDEDFATDFYPTETYYKGLPLLHQIYHHIKNSGSQGITIRELSEITGLSRSFIRSILKRLIKEHHCKCFEEISGRRHIKRYMVGENAKNIAAASEIFQMLSKDTPPLNNTLENDECNNTSETDQNSDKVCSKVDVERKHDFPCLEEENVPYRTLRRIALIIKTIKTHKYRLFFQVYKHILEEEAKEGLTAIADRATVNRILQKLQKDGLIQIVDLMQKDKNGTSMKVYTEPTFVLDDKLADTLLHTHLTYKPGDITKVAFDENSEWERQFCGILLENLAEMKKMLHGIKFKQGKIEPRDGKEREMTCSPKFVRLNIIHDLMFYLMYDYTGITNKSQEELLEELSKTCQIDDDLKNEMPKIYGTQLTSYLFIPPLKEREGVLSGWFLISDILLRLPLSIFVKILRIYETTPELLTYLNHPIRKYFLVKDLPINVRHTLFKRLQCLISFSSDLRRLCFLGLIQYGAKCSKEQYQTLIYLNKNASIFDTTLSPPSYICLPSDIKFPVKHYKFETKEDVKRYWQDMCHICLGTNLGAKANMIGKEVVSIKELSKESLKISAEPKTPAKALLDDNGSIPGDHLGAGGLDSVMFSFLRSNWIGPVTKAKSISTPKPLKKIPLQKLKKKLSMKRLRRHVQKPKLKNSNRLEITLPKPLLNEEIPASSRTRKVKEREFRIKRAKKTYYDEMDMEALKLKNTLRVNWSPAEDHLLLICQVAMLYIGPSPRGLMRIPWSEVRSYLQKNLAESKNKTQKAIARRVKYMMKNPTTRRSVALSLEELSQIPEVSERFDCEEIAKTIKPSNPNVLELQNKLYVKFHALTDYIKERFSKGSSFKVKKTEKDLLPDTLEEFNVLYDFETKKENEELTLKKIRESVIRAILMSSLSCRADKTSAAIQLFEIYRQYEDDELHRAIKNLNVDKVVTVRKVNNAEFKNGRYLPLSLSPCKLSFSFQMVLNTKYSHNLYPGSFDLIRKIIDRNEDEYYVDLNECNVPLYLLACKDLILFGTRIPEQIIVLDSDSSMDEAAYTKILQRYCDILKFSGTDSKLVCASGQLLTSENDSLSIDQKNKRPPVDAEHADVSSAKKIKLEDLTGKEKVETIESCSKENKPMLSGKNIEKAGASRLWRVVLYMMREKAKKEINNFPGNRAQEFFYVNASEVYCSIKEEFKYYVQELYPKLMNDLVKAVVSRFSVPLSFVSEEAVYQEFVRKDRSDEQLTVLKEVLKFISEKRELGATNEELKSNFSMDLLPDIIQHLVESKIVIKTGIQETRYVGQKYSSPWLLNSFKITRLEREKMKPSDLSAVEIPETAVESKEDDGSCIPKKKKKGIISLEDMKNSDYTPPKCSMEESNKVKMIIRPWIRVDGSLNRKVLDRLLGSVLGYIMMNPGITIKSVMNRFAPSILLAWSRDLIEILHNIGCISFKTFTVTRKSSLFNKEVVSFDEYTGLDDDDCVVIDPKVDAITILGLFIGKRTYSKDFLMD